jgi:hypothetical protein
MYMRTVVTWAAGTRMQDCAGSRQASGPGHRPSRRPWHRSNKLADTSAAAAALIPCTSRQQRGSGGRCRNRLEWPVRRPLLGRTQLCAAASVPCRRGAGHALPVHWCPSRPTLVLALGTSGLPAALASGRRRACCRRVRGARRVGCRARRRRPRVQLTAAAGGTRLAAGGRLKAQAYGSLHLNLGVDGLVRVRAGW